MLPGLVLLCLSLPLVRAKVITPPPRRAAAAWTGLFSPRLPACPGSSSRLSRRSSNFLQQPRRRCRPLKTMADTGKGKATAGGPSTQGEGGRSKGAEKLGEAEVLNLVLDYLATKGFTEAEQTLRQSVSAGGASPVKQNSNQQSGRSPQRL